MDPKLSNSLTAYRKNSGCDTTLLRLIEKWKMDLDSRQVVRVLSSDMSKAFDFVSPPLLIKKLESYSFSGSALNLLLLNVRKYQSMVLGAESEADNINLPIDGVNIEQLKSIKLFSEHISYVCKKASQQIGILRHLRKLIPTHAKLQLYKAAILPHLTYCSTIWHFCRASDKRKVERLQERALGVVFNNESVFYEELLRLAELPSFVNRRLQEIAILMFKIHV